MNNNTNIKYCPLIKGNCLKEKCAFWIEYDTDFLEAQGCDYSGRLGIIEGLEQLNDRLGDLVEIAPQIEKVESRLHGIEQTMDIFTERKTGFF